MRTAFIDESQRNGACCLAAAIVEQAMITKVRSMLTGAARSKRRIRHHFVRESPQERRRLLGEFAMLPSVSAVAVSVHRGEPSVAQRSRALRVLAARLLTGGVNRIVLDHVENVQQQRDRADLMRVLGASAVEYTHDVSGSTEPLLWVADAIAWCAGQPRWQARTPGWVEWVDL